MSTRCPRLLVFALLLPFAACGGQDPENPSSPNADGSGVDNANGDDGSDANENHNENVNDNADDNADDNSNSNSNANDNLNANDNGNDNGTPPCVPLTCASAAAECGTLPDGCGGTLGCGSCASGEICGGGGDANRCGDAPCEPTTCAALSRDCGAVSDGCSSTLECGTCSAPESCGGAGEPGVCGCTPTTCEALGVQCGQTDDGCGGLLECGTCSAPESCGGAGEPGVCGCTPTTCEALGVQCGQTEDGCGGLLECGTCSAPESCGGAGEPGVCGCAPTTCEALGAECGVADDGCGGTLNCNGGCAFPDICGGGAGVPNQCDCTPDLLAICGRGANGINCAIENGVGTFSGAYLARSGFEDSSGWNFLAYYSTIRFPDINGDGFADVCGRDASGIFCAHGDGEGLFGELTFRLDAFRDDQGWTDPDNYGTLQFGDVNGDGRDDICGRGDNAGFSCAIAQANGTFQWQGFNVPQMNDSGGFDPLDGWGPMQLADLTGDGIAEVCARFASGNPEGLYCAYGGPSGFSGFGPVGRNMPSPFMGIFGDDAFNVDQWDAAHLWGTIQFADLDGDGDLDACSLDQTEGQGIRCGLVRGGVIFSDDYRSYTNNFAPAAGWDTDFQWGTLRFPDVTGDGRADVCGLGPGGIFCGVGTGTSFQAATNWLPEFASSNEALALQSTPARWGTLRFIDIDHDGRDDVCVRGPDGYVCATSNGVDGFNSPYLATDAFRDAQNWGNFQDYWGTLQMVRIRRGDCRTVGRGLPWGTSAIPPRSP